MTLSIFCVFLAQSLNLQNIRFNNSFFFVMQHQFQHRVSDLSNKMEKQNIKTKQNTYYVYDIDFGDLVYRIGMMLFLICLSRKKRNLHRTKSETDTLITRYEPIVYTFCVDEPKSANTALDIS